MKRKSNKKKHLTQIRPHVADEFASNMKDVAVKYQIPVHSFNATKAHVEGFSSSDRKLADPSRVRSLTHSLLTVVSWTKTKQIYRFSDSLLDEFFENRSLAFPVSGLHMPYTTVYFEPEHIILLDYLNILGAYFTIGDVTKEGKLRCCLSLLFYHEEDDNKEKQIMSFGSFVDPQMTMADAVGDVSNIALQFGMKGDDYKAFVSIVEMFFMCAAYISSEQPDVTMKEKISGQYHPKSGGGKLKKTSIQNWDVGYRIVKDRKTNESNTFHTRNVKSVSYHVRPHTRKAHWHTYWTGKNRTVAKVRWVRDIDVNPKLGNSVAVVHSIHS